MMRFPLAWRPFIVLAATSAPARSQAPATPVRFELPNGLRVWVQEDHARPMALVQVAYKIGAINEDPGSTGTAHYVEHMVYRATEGIRNEDAYGYIDRIGGRYTGGTSRDATVYGETVPTWALEDALRVTAERMGRALFDSVEFERERNNVVTEANGFARLDPVSAYRDALMLTSFEAHPYRYSSNTWARDNLLLTRAEAFEFYKRYYGPNNAVLTVVGDVRVRDVRRLVEKHFAPLAPAARTGEVRIVEPPQRVEKRVVLRYPGERQYLDFVYRAPHASHPDYPSLVVLDRVLVPRLRRAFSIISGIEVSTTHAVTPYPFVYRISIIANGSVDPERLRAVVEDEIARLRVEDVRASEITGARVDVISQGRGGGGRSGGASGVSTNGVPPRQSSLTQIANELAERENFGWEVSRATREQIQRAQQTVTASDLRAYADRWLRPTQRTLGQLLPGNADFMPEWSNGRALVGERLDVPPLTTAPAKRLRPTPVPPRGLEPLGKLSLETARSVLDSGVIVRAARTKTATATIHARVAFGRRSTGEDAVANLAARSILADSGLRALGARSVMTAFANDGHFDIRVTAEESAVPAALATIANALTPRAVSASTLDSLRPRSDTAGRGRGGGGANGGPTVNADVRARVLRAIAPAWRVSDPTIADLARVTAADVSAFLATHLHGGAIVVSVASASPVDESLENARLALTALPRGKRSSSGQHRADAEVEMAEERVVVANEPQVTVLAGLPAPPRGTTEWRALELLNYIVGVPSYGGRLGWALTKSGLTYSSSATTTLAATGGHVLFSTKCDTRNLDATVQAIREVVEGIAQRGVEAWEVDEAKAFTLGRMLLYGPRDDSGGDAIATALLDSEYLGTELLDPPSWSRGYLSVTRDEINAVARRYYRPDRLKLVALGAIPIGEHRSPFAPGTFRSLFEP